MLFSRDDLVSGFHALGSAAVEAGKIIDLAIYGGSCLMLVSNFRDASQDVDAVASTDQAFVDRIARSIAGDRGWPLDWLNDGVRVYLSPNVEQPHGHSLFASYPSERVTGLRVYVPTPEYMLAMKLMSLRIDAIEGEKDKTDIENLIAILGITSKEDLIAHASAYYPEARTTAKLLLTADQLLRGSRGKGHTMMKRPDTLIDVANASKDARMHGLAMAGFLDNFYTLPDRRQAMIDPEPPLTGKPEMDAYLGAVAEHLARRWDLNIPAWTDDPARFLHKPTFASSIEDLKPLLLAQSPLAFRKRMIFVEHEPLTRARMPRS